MDSNLVLVQRQRGEVWLKKPSQALQGGFCLSYRHPKSSKFHRRIPVFFIKEWKSGMAPVVVKVEAI